MAKVKPWRQVATSREDLPGTDDKRWVAGVLASKKGLGL